MPIKCQFSRGKLVPTAVYNKSSWLRIKRMRHWKLPNGEGHELLWSYWQGSYRLTQHKLPPLLHQRLSRLNKLPKRKMLPSFNIRLFTITSKFKVNNKPMNQNSIFGSSNLQVK